jgi:hypothetical protein
MAEIYIDKFKVPIELNDEILYTRYGDETLRTDTIIGQTRDYFKLKSGSRTGKPNKNYPEYVNIIVFRKGDKKLQLI